MSLGFSLLRLQPILLVFAVVKVGIVVFAVVKDINWRKEAVLELQIDDEELLEFVDGFRQIPLKEGGTRVADQQCDYRNRL